MSTLTSSRTAGRPAHFARGLFYVIITVLIWGAFLPVSKTAIQSINLYWLNTLRFGLVVPAFAGLLWWREGRQAFRFDGHLGSVFVYSLLGYGIYTNLVYEGARLISAPQGAALLALSPLWFAVYQWADTGKPPRPATLVCIAAVILGEILVVTRGDLEALGQTAHGRSEALGAVLVILSGIAWVGYSTGAHHLRHWSPLRFSTLTCLFGWLIGLCFTVSATALGHAQAPTFNQVASVWPEFLFLAVMVSFISFITWNSAVRELGPLNAGLFAPFSPIITFVIALAQGQSFSTLELGGALIVLIALVANNVLARQAREREIASAARAGANKASLQVSP